MVEKQRKSRAQFLAQMRDNLTAIRGRLNQGIANQLRTGRDSGRDDCLDSSDLASAEHDREISTALSDRERMKLAQIDNALKRIAARKYGLCEVCGLDVGAERLKTLPFTLFCCDCQQESERDAKTRRHYQEPDSDAYSLGSISAPEDGNRTSQRSSGNGSSG